MSGNLITDSIMAQYMLLPKLYEVLFDVPLKVEGFEPTVENLGILAMEFMKSKGDDLRNPNLIDVRLIQNQSHWSSFTVRVSEATSWSSANTLEASMSSARRKALPERQEGPNRSIRAPQQTNRARPGAGSMSPRRKLF